MKNHSFLFLFSHNPSLLPPSLEFIYALKGLGHYADILFVGKPRDRSHLDKFLIDNIYSVDINHRTLFDRIAFPLRMKRAFKAHVSSKKYNYIFACDIVSLQILSGFDLPGKVYWAFELMGIRKRFSFSWDGIRSLFFYHYLNEMNLLIVPSEQRKELFSVGALKVRRFVLGNWRSKDRVALTSKNQKTSKDSAKIRLVFAGKISFNSGIQRIIPKIAEHSIFSLTLVGKMDEQFRSWLEDNKFENVSYMGFVSNDQLITYLSEFDISVCSYDTIGVTNISALNPAPTKVGDAIAAGVMILSSDQKYLKDIVENNNLGFCYSEHNLSEVLTKISRLKRLEIDEFKQRVRESFEMDYCMEVNIPELLNVLEQNE